ncbi:MAG: AAC(3)-I family aminoglycoside N-acetyltransferase [Proteobacteria bacterium]|nr:AAC(3)-I family aminoglycoside N-acetyltransferase [Pseudomonadota bacterium]
MDGATIRRLDVDDVGTMRGMLSMFGEAFKDPAAYRHAQPHDTYLARLLSRKTLVALAAIAEGEVIGGIAAYVLDKFEQVRSEVYIYDLAVAEAQRRRGVATALIAELRGIAADIGAWVIFVQAEYDDDPAIALYEKLGAREDVMHFDITVP